MKRLVTHNWARLRYVSQIQLDQGWRCSEADTKWARDKHNGEADSKWARDKHNGEADTKWARDKHNGEADTKWARDKHNGEADTKWARDKHNGEADGNGPETNKMVRQMEMVQRQTKW